MYWVEVRDLYPQGGGGSGTLWNLAATHSSDVPGHLRMTVRVQPADRRDQY